MSFDFKNWKRLQTRSLFYDYGTVNRRLTILKQSVAAHLQFAPVLQPNLIIPKRLIFATEIIRITDIETAKNLTGQTGEHILTYLHNNEDRMRDTVRRRENFRTLVRY